jgi:hypothetical protein
MRLPPSIGALSGGATTDPALEIINRSIYLDYFS